MAIDSSIYNDIAVRTGGDIYLGVVGPVRSGKSTFIKKFMETLVIPNINEGFTRQRANDELPQSSAGRTIMTTEPKFIPEEAVALQLPDNATMNVRMIDCVGYIIPSAIGYIEKDMPRMVMTPWFDEEIPFNMAAEIGTKKVINEHSTIGIVITTDGSISDIDRDEYEEAEERVIRELKEINKPFIVLMNCTNPENKRDMCKSLENKYCVPVLPVNCLELTEDKIIEILSSILFEFPIKEIQIDLPKWICSLSVDHPIRQELNAAVKNTSNELSKIKDCEKIVNTLSQNENVLASRIIKTNLGEGSARISVELKPDLFYKILTETAGIEINNDKELLVKVRELAQISREYNRIKDALNEVEATGYGIVMPSIEEMRLEEPEIMKQGGRYGVRLRASAPSIHMMKADINTEVSPIVGSEKQSEDLVMSLMSEFEENPLKIWDSNIFGKSLHELVNEGLHAKLSKMPMDARMKVQETLERLINEGCSGLICIIL